MWDQNNQIETVTSSIGEIKYSYDDVGNLIKTLYPNNTAEIRTYDDLNRLIFLKNVSLDPDTGEETGIISSYDYTLDKVGNRVAVEEHDGRVVNYVYDDLYRLTQEAITNDGAVRTIGYTYDGIGNRLSSNDSELGLTTYTYNDNDWLLSEETNGKETAYTYDNNGNTLSKVNNATNEQTVYTWDDENRLIGAEITTDAGTTTTEYKYNADGVRVASIVDGEETRYLVDANRNYAQVLEEYNPDGNVEVAYIYGHDLIYQVRNGDVSFYHVDGLGSTRALSDSEGNVTDVYIYDAYGNVINSSGSTENNYLYTGEQYDSELEDYYLRARYYNPDTGRFTARDPFEGWLSDPLSLAKYPYVHGNPVNLTDPTGLYINGYLSLTVAITSVLATQLLINRTFPIATIRREDSDNIIVPGYLKDINHSGVNSFISIPITNRQYQVVKEKVEECNLTIGECDFSGFPVIVWGNDLPEIAQHTADSLSDLPSFLARIQPGWNQYEGPISPLGSGGPISWYNSVDGPCQWIPGVYQPEFYNRDCDEYPYNSTLQGGPYNHELGKVSLRLVDRRQNRTQGDYLLNFYYFNGVNPNHPYASWFGVKVSTEPTYYIDKEGIKRNIKFPTITF